MVEIFRKRPKRLLISQALPAGPCLSKAKFSELSFDMDFVYYFSLFQNAKLVISLHSSLLLDSLYFKVPTIFFQSFTPLWLKVHKDKSCYLNLGAKYCSVNTPRNILKHIMMR